MVMVSGQAPHVGVATPWKIEAFHEAELVVQLEGPEHGRPRHARLAAPTFLNEVGGSKGGLAAHDHPGHLGSRARPALAGTLERRKEGTVVHGCSVVYLRLGLNNHSTNGRPVKYFGFHTRA